MQGGRQPRPRLSAEGRRARRTGDSGEKVSWHPDDDDGRAGMSPAAGACALQGQLVDDAHEIPHRRPGRPAHAAHGGEIQL